MINVYIVDDSVEVRKRLDEMVSLVDGIVVVGQAGTAEEAIQGIQQLKPDAAIIDIQMPGGNGFQIMEAIKLLDTPPVVIMLTAFPYPQYRKKCLDAGADYFFDKSIEFSRVTEVLKQLVDEHLRLKKSKSR